jgi:hypothetical protein
MHMVQLRMLIMIFTIGARRLPYYVSHTHSAQGVVDTPVRLTPIVYARERFRIVRSTARGHRLLCSIIAVSFNQIRARMT